MKSSLKTIKMVSISSMILLAIFLTACGGDGGNGPPPTYSISGQVTTNETGLSGVTITLSGAGSGTTTTDTDGDYSFSGLSDGSYTVTPSLTDYTFTPTSRNVTVSGADVSGVDFSASSFSIKTETTDSNGEAVFIDDTTGEEVRIRVVDVNTDTPLQDMCVIYTDGDGFEKFVVDDPTNTYFPSIAFYEHNSPHEIKMNPLVTKNYHIDFIEDSEAETPRKAITSIFYDPYCEATTVAEAYYVAHLTGEEFAERREIGRGIVIFFLGYGPAAVAYGALIADVLDNHLEDVLVINGERIPIKSKNWDWYRVKYDLKNIQGEIISVDHWESVFIPSQAPTVTIDEIEVSGNNVSASWTGNDSTEYSEVGLPTMADATVRCEGVTAGSDLTYSYRITKDGVVYFDWTSTAYRSANFTIEDDGTYTFEIKVKDDVENVGTASKQFSIGDVKYELSIQGKVVPAQGYTLPTNTKIGVFDLSNFHAGEDNTPEQVRAPVNGDYSIILYPSSIDDCLGVNEDNCVWGVVLMILVWVDVDGDDIWDANEFDWNNGCSVSFVGGSENTNWYVGDRLTTAEYSGIAAHTANDIPI